MEPQLHHIQFNVRAENLPFYRDLLFGTPQHRPDFAADDAHTYYQVMFASPDRILLEVVYTGPKEPATTGQAG